MKHQIVTAGFPTVVGLALRILGYLWVALVLIPVGLMVAWLVVALAASALWGAP